MLSNQSGPRDWSPSPRTDPPLATARRWEAPRPIRSTGRATGVVSFVFGLGAAIVAIAPVFSASGAHSWVFTTVGISAVVSGVVALRDPYSKRAWRGILPALGIVFGAFGTLIMGANLVSFSSHPGQGVLQPLEFQGNQTAPHAAVPSSTTHESERMSLVQTEGTIAYLLKQTVTPTGGYPDRVAPTADGLVVTPAGSVQLPAGATFAYSPAADARGFSLSLLGPTGAEAHYDTASGVVTSK